MIKRSWRRLLAAPLILTLTLQPLLAEAQMAAAIPTATELAPELPVTPAVVEQAGLIRASGELFRTRVIPTTLRAGETTARFVGKWGGEILQLQALLISMAVLALQASKEREEFAMLSSHTYKDTANPNAAMCSPEGNGSPTDILCSGEFLFGALAGAGFIVGNSLVGTLFHWLFSATKTRVAALSFIFSMASGPLMIAGSTGAAFLWTQAVKELPDAKQIQQANGIAGRAAYYFATGQGKAFMASDDGALFKTILNTCFVRITLDDKLRSQWIYNTYRFGLRGEAFASMAALMAASASSEIASAGILGVAGGGLAATLSAPFVAFIIGSALGIVAITVLVQNGVPQKITQMIQSLRDAVDDQRLAWNRSNLEIALDEFKLDSRPISHRRQENPEHWLQVRKDLVNRTLTSQSQLRGDYTNVQIEKLYEVLVELRTLQTKIDLATKILRDKNLSKYTYTEVDGKFVPTLEATKLWCNNPMKRCDSDVPGATQLNALKTLKASVDQAEEALPELSERLISPYMTDEKFIADQYTNPNYSYPPDLGESIWNFKIKTTALRKRLLLVLAGANDKIAARFNLTFDPKPNASGQSERSRMEAVAVRELSADYTQGYDEDETYLSMRRANGLQ